jgi:hypothetical protein
MILSISSSRGCLTRFSSLKAVYLELGPLSGQLRVELASCGRYSWRNLCFLVKPGYMGVEPYKKKAWQESFDIFLSSWTHATNAVRTNQRDDSARYRVTLQKTMLWLRQISKGPIRHELKESWNKLRLPSRQWDSRSILSWKRDALFEGSLYHRKIQMVLQCLNPWYRYSRLLELTKPSRTSPNCTTISNTFYYNIYLIYNI